MPPLKHPQINYVFCGTLSRLPTQSVRSAAKKCPYHLAGTHTDIFLQFYRARQRQYSDIRIRQNTRGQTRLRQISHRKTICAQVYNL